MNTVTQAIIPQLGESIKSSHLYSLSEAFNSRILSGAGDSHWRIPYYIFSTFFRKPRLDDNMLYTPESEFFDFYQFVNPSTGETWPTNPPQEPEGANLQTNFLNRFIFGMNYQTKDKDGNWLYEREDVRVQIGQDKIKNDAASFRGFVFPFFTAVGTDSGTDRQYTSFGISSEIYSSGYTSGKPENPQGNSFGGYYGKNPLITSANGCGVDPTTGYEYPASVSTVIKIDGVKNDKNSVSTYNVCNEGVSAGKPDQYTIINDGNPNSILAFTIKNNIPTNVDVFAKNKYHLSQSQSTVFFGREQKNHIHRLLYNYITYAKGFDFDWFFNNQYSYAPEIGSFIKMVSTYDQNPDQYYGRLNLLNTDIQISQARLTLQKTGLSASRINNGSFDQNGTTDITITFASSHSYNIGDYIFISFYNSSGALLKMPIEGYYFITGKTTNTITIQGSSSAVANGIVDIRNFIPIISGYNVKTIDDSAYIQTKYYDADGKTLVTKENITGTNSVFNYLLNNDFLAKGWENIPQYLYSYDSNDPDKVIVPLGFALNNIQVTSSTLKKFTLTVHYYVNGIYVSYRDIKFDYTNITPGNAISKAISSDIFLATTTPEIVYSVKFEIRDIEILPPNSTASVLLYPIFLFAYKPKIEDAYALLRACTYYGTKDGNLDDADHALNRAYYFSDRLKDSGVLGSGDIPRTEGEMHNPLSVELNTNAIYEASRRLSLYARIIKPDNFIEVLNDDKTLRFKRYSMQSANARGSTSSKVKYADVSSSLTIPYNVFAIDDVVKWTDIQPYLTQWTNLDSVYYSKFKKYNFFYEDQKITINAQLNNDLIASLSTSTSYPTRVNKNNIEFEPTSYKFNYDSVIEGGNGKYLYYQFEDQYGIKFNDESQDAPNYYAKRYTSDDTSVSTKVYLDESGTISLLDTDLIFLGKTNEKKASFYIYVFTRVPNAGGLATARQGGRQFYHVDKNGSFITRQRTDLWRYNYSGTQAVQMSGLGDLEATTLPDDAIYSKLTYPNQIPIILANSISDTDIKSSYTLSLTELTDLANILYNNYKSSDIQLNKEDASISYVGNSVFVDFSTFTDINDYNKYLAEYKIKVSYFKNQVNYNLQNFDASIEVTPKNINLYTLDSSNNVINTYVYNLDTEISLPNLSGSEIKIKIEVPVNNRVDKITKNKVNLDVYLAIINAALLEDDPVLEAINREGGVLISRTAKLINTDTAAPTSRDMFQGIAPSIDNVLTGSLLVGQEYKVSGGTILHDGQNYGVGYSSIFIAKNTQYSITSGTTPLVIQNNGIIEIAPPSGFSNEWAFWINFLPYSGSPTSSFKEEVYGATNSPFIDRCHVNSKSIIKSNAENLYFNLGLPKTYIPEMPPSYRYVPLLTNNGLIFENMVGDSNYKNNFYRACPAFKPPYKIKKAYVSSSDGYNSVYIELDRKIDGYSLAQSSTPSETYRTDYNGLNDWVNKGSGIGNLAFRLGDASLTNDSGNNQVVSNTSNGYQGSYYPRFFFVKLMPKPYSDKNNTAEDLKDSPLNHDAIKQAELYLEAMREGFTANSSASRGRLSCENIKGHLTPPDYKYDQLLINSTTTADYFGNKWPSLLTSSINFNLVALRGEDNPRGFGAIPFVGTYLEPYSAIARSINSLISFRVPFPLSFTATQYTYGTSETFKTGEWNDSTYTRSGAGGGGPSWANFNSPSSVSDIVGSINPVVTTYNLRNSSGGLIGVSATQGYAIGDLAPDNFGISLSNGRIDKFYSTASININGLDSGLKNIAYSEIISILPNIFSVPVFIQKSSNITKLIPTPQPIVDNCARYYYTGSGASLQYFYLKTVYSDPYLSCEPRSGGVVNPDPIQIGRPFYRVIESNNCSTTNEVASESFQRTSFSSVSTTTYTIFEPGFQIVTLNTETLKSGDVT
jgi:hypothetical protein